MTVEAAIDKIKATDQTIDTADRIDSDQLSQKIMKVDTFLKGKTHRKLEEMKTQLSPEDYKRFQKQVAILELEFDTEINTLQYKLNDVELDTEEEYKQLIEGYSYIFDGMEEDIKEFEHILGDDKEIPEDELIAKVKEFSYSALYLDENTYANGKIKQLVKGVIDTVVIENAELAKQVYDTKGAILVDMMKTIFSWEGLKGIAKGLGESIWGLFSGDVYKTGRSIGDLGLITTGAGALGTGLRKAGKVAMKQSIKMEGRLIGKALKTGSKYSEKTGKILQLPSKGGLDLGKKAGGKSLELVKKGAKKIEDGYGKVKDEVRALHEPMLVTPEGIEMPLNMKSKMDGDGKGSGPKKIDKEKGKSEKPELTEEQIKEIQESIKAEHLEEHFKTKINVNKYIPDFKKEVELSPEQISKLKDNIKNMLAKETFNSIEEQLEAIGVLMLRVLHRRDPTTALHSSRMASYIDLVGPSLSLSKKEIFELKISAMLHDAGKIGTPNEVLNKAGKLTNEEFGHMKGHVSGTEEFLEGILDEIEHEGILKGAYQHHEKVGGGGYPRGLVSDEIHKYAKIMTVVDVFEAMTARRVYKKPIVLEKVLAELGKIKEEQIIKTLVEGVEKQKIISPALDSTTTEIMINTINGTNIKELKEINPNIITKQESL